MIWYIHYYSKYRDVTSESAKGLQAGPLSKRQEWWVVGNRSHLVRNTSLFQRFLLELTKNWWLEDNACQRQQPSLEKKRAPFSFKIVITLTVATAGFQGGVRKITVSVKVRRAGKATTVLLLHWSNQETQIYEFMFYAFSNILGVEFILSFIYYTVGIVCNILYCCLTCLNLCL